MATTKAALFVDFDNIYLSLQKSDRRAAENFARQPDRWLRWLAAGTHEPRGGEDSPSPAARSVLLRRCYLTPSRFGEYRPFFARAGFTVVDCPPLTRMGKNSADIVMVMDVLDALEHATRFEEFIVFSGDADFTPVLLRLRTHDRRTAVLTDALTAAAYRAASDIAIPQELFIEDALGIDERPGGLFADNGAHSLAAQLTEVDLAEVAGSVVAALSEKGRLVSTDLVPIFGRWPAFASGPRWFGQGTLRRLCERLAELRPQIEIEPGDELAMRLRTTAPIATESGETTPFLPGLQSEVGGTEAPLRDRILAEVRSMLAASDEPIEMASLGANIIRVIGPVAKASDWAGAGTLGNLIRRASAPDMSVHVVGGAVGFVFDPNRHSLATLSTVAGEQVPLDLPPAMLEVVYKVASVTECPRLDQAEYTTLFSAIAAFDFGSDFNMNRASAAIRDACVAAGRPVGRRAANFVLTGLRFHDFDFFAAKTAADVARAFKDNLIDLCDNASLQLSEAELRLIDEWLGLSQVDRAATTPAAPQPEDWTPVAIDPPTLEPAAPGATTGGAASPDHESAPDPDRPPVDAAKETPSLPRPGWWNRTVGS